MCKCNATTRTRTRQTLSTRSIIPTGMRTRQGDIMNNRAPLDFHHLGLAVRDPAPALRFLKELGYAAGETVRDPIQNVHLRLCRHPTQPTVELIWPTETPGPLQEILKDDEERLYHVCYRTASISETIAKWSAEGLEHFPLSDPAPAPLFNDCPVAFFYLPGLGTVELLEMEGS